MEVKGSEWKENERRVFGHMITEAVEYSTGTVPVRSRRFEGSGSIVYTLDGSATPPLHRTYDT